MTSRKFLFSTLLLFAVLVAGVALWARDASAKTFLVGRLANTQVSTVPSQSASTPIRDRWTASSRLYQGAAPDKFILNASIGAQNFKAPWKGISQWTEISPGWEPAAAPWKWQSRPLGAEYDVRALEDITAGQVIEWKVNDSWLRFQPMALNWTNDLDQIFQISMPKAAATFSASGETLGWTGAYGNGLDLRWRLENTALRKMLTVNAGNNLPAPPAFIVSGGNPVLELNFVFAVSSDLTLYINGAAWNARDKVDTGQVVEFRKAGTPVFYFAAPSASDAVGDFTEATMRFKKSGNSLYVSVRVPKVWLDTAVFPVTIDPTLDLQVGASTDDAFQASTDAVTVAGAGLPIVDATTEHVGLRFVATIPAGATITLTQLGVYIYSAAYDEPQHQLRGQAAAAPLTFTTASNNIDSRPRTTATHQWNSTNLGAGTADLWEWGATVAGAGNGADVGSIIQENVDALGELTALVFIYEQHTEDALRDLAINTWDIDTTLAPKLHIEYTAGGEPTPTPTPEEGMIIFFSKLPIAAPSPSPYYASLRQIPGRD